MLSRWIVLVISLLLIITTIQAKYHLKKSITREKPNSTFLLEEQRNSDLLTRSNQTTLKNSTSSGIKRVCVSQSCSDNPMTQDASRRDTFLLTFSQFELSNDLDVSLKSSPSATFFKNNSKRRKPNGSDIARNRLRKRLQRIMMTMIKRVLGMDGFSARTRNQTSGSSHNETTRDATRKLTVPKTKETNEKTSHNKGDRGINDKKTQDWNELSEVLLPVIKQEFGMNLNNDPGNTEQQSKEQINSFENAQRSVDKNRTKREFSRQSWMMKEFQGKDDVLKMHAFVIKDEHIPPCCSPADPVSNTRYFMCSGAILTLKHAITTASCVHFADIYEEHISEELAILVGAFTSTPYVIKINRFEMHPNYNFDVEAHDHATYNLAMLFLSCSVIPESVLVPTLPKGLYDDVGHVCCGRSCEVVTIIQTPNNYHIARVLSAKHLPSPIHDDMHLNIPWENLGVGQRMIRFRNRSKTIRRQIRSPGKLAGTPLFLLKDLHAESTVESRKSLKSQNPKRKRVKNIFDEIANARRGAGNTSLKKESSPSTESTSGKKRPVFQFPKNISNIEKDLPTIDWKQVEESLGSQISEFNKSKMEKFAQHLVDETMKRLGSVVGDKEYQQLKENTTKNISKQHKGSEHHGFFMEHLPPSKENNLIDFANVFAGVLKSVLPPHHNDNVSVSSDLTVDEKDLSLPPPKNVYCPPLGSPIIKDGQLIAMISYTCDDVQNWVAWKYVNIAQNLNWIRKRISVAQHQPPVNCETPLRASTKQAVPAQDAGGASTSERRLREFLPGIEKQYEQTANQYSRVAAKSSRLHYGGIFNPAPLPGQQFVSQQGESITKPPPVKPGRFSAVSNINANTCFTKPDGSTDCRSITNTYTVQ